jgi:glucose/arabinose dehydrogenase
MSAIVVGEVRKLTLPELSDCGTFLEPKSHDGFHMSACLIPSDLLGSIRSSACRNLRRALAIMTLATMHSPLQAAGIEMLTVPAGFTIETLPFEVPNARQMALTEAGHLIIGTRKRGDVYAVKNALTSATPEVVVLFDDLTMPSGVAIHEGDLYIAARSDILRVNDIDQSISVNPTADLVTDDLPRKSHHGWKYIKFDRDGMLYVPVGAPCNICLSDDPRFAAILRMNPKTGDSQIIGQGIRNIVGMDWHPTTGDLWVSNNARDMLGDDIPADELNVIPVSVNEVDENAPHYGYPFVHSNAANLPAGIIDDPKFGDHKARPETMVPAALRMQAHAAPLGMVFYTDQAFPPHYRDALFVAEHGSWNRSSKVGYQVSVMTTSAKGDLSYEPFITGWLQGENAWGRPNDVLLVPDGSLLISDDKAGVIYRVRYQGPVAAVAAAVR